MKRLLLASFIIVVAFMTGLIADESENGEICPSGINVCGVLEALLLHDHFYLKIVRGLDYDLERDIDLYPCIMDPINNAVCAPTCAVLDSLLSLSIHPEVVNTTMTQVLGQEPKCFDNFTDIYLNDNPYHVFRDGMESMYRIK